MTAITATPITATSTVEPGGVIRIRVRFDDGTTASNKIDVDYPTAPVVAVMVTLNPSPTIDGKYIPNITMYDAGRAERYLDRDVANQHRCKRVAWAVPVVAA